MTLGSLEWISSIVCWQALPPAGRSGRGAPDPLALLYAAYTPQIDNRTSAKRASRRGYPVLGRHVAPRGASSIVRSGGAPTREAVSSRCRSDRGRLSKTRRTWSDGAVMAPVVGWRTSTWWRLRFATDSEWRGQWAPSGRARNLHCSPFVVVPWQRPLACSSYTLAPFGPDRQDAIGGAIGNVDDSLERPRRPYLSEPAGRISRGPLRPLTGPARRRQSVDVAPPERRTHGRTGRARRAYDHAPTGIPRRSHDQSTLPRGTTHSTVWPVTAAIKS